MTTVPDKKPTTRKEIGSEFTYVPLSPAGNGLFGSDTQWYLSGRSALAAVIASLSSCRSVAMPSWCCESMIKPFVQAGIDVKFYPVYFDGSLKQEIRLDCDILFLTDYFGYISPVPDVAGFGGAVIHDITHSLFSCPETEGEYVFGSLRKWCGVPSGGFALSPAGKLPRGSEYLQEYISLRKRAMKLKAHYIDGTPDENGNPVTGKDYLGLFAEAEDLLDSCDGIYTAPVEDITEAKSLDAELIRSRRRANAEILRHAFRDMLIFPEMNETDCPLFVPVLVPDGKRDGLRKHLINNKIYCPVHWPLSIYHAPDERTLPLYMDGLSLVCDQRYGEDDMLRIVRTVKDHMKEV